MYFCMAWEKTAAPEEQVVCEICRGARAPGEKDWQHYPEEVEEVEISWANGDTGVTTHFPTRQFFDLCPACAVRYRLQNELTTG